MGMQPETPDTPRAGLYIHVPFCVKKCPYCSFYSTTDLDRRGEFIEALCEEIRLTPAEGLVFDTIYFGGGTPSLLRQHQIEAVMNALRCRFCLSDGLEITLEMNPATFSPRFVDSLLQAGINRIHLGVQSFDDGNLRFLERIHSSREACNALEALRSGGIGNLGIDLIYGLPGQAPKTWTADLKHALTFRPEHLSCYMLSYEPNTPFQRRRREGLGGPDPAVVRTLFEQTVHHLTENGYEQYEISNFARREEFQSRHNQKYWHHAPYLGLGPSAHSFLEPRRWWNCAGLQAYLTSLAQGRIPVEGSEVLTPNQLMLESIFLGLRTSGGVEVNGFEQRFGLSFLNHFNDVVDELCSLKLLRIFEDRVMLTRKGMVYSDSVTARLADRLELPEAAGENIA